MRYLLTFLQSIRHRKQNRVLFLLAVLFVLAVGLSAHSASAFESRSGDGKVMYGDGTKVGQADYCIQGKTCPTIGYFGNKASVSTGTVVPVWSVMKASPVVDGEYLAGNLNPNGRLEMMLFASPTWSLDWTENSVGSRSLNTRAFDIAYENSGEAVAAWARTKTTSGSLQTGIEYRVWNGSAWGASSSYTFTTNVGKNASISWIEMASHPATGSNQNDIALCYEGGGPGSGRVNNTQQLASSSLGCIVWNGKANAWGNEKYVDHDLGEFQQVTGGTKGFSVFFNQSQANFAVAYTDGNDSNTNLNVESFASPSWTATVSFNSARAEEYVDCASMRTISNATGNKNKAFCTMSATVSTTRVQGVNWTGTAFSAGSLITQDSGPVANATARMPSAVAWFDFGATSPSRHASSVWASADTTDLDNSEWGETDQKSNGAQSHASTTGTDVSYDYYNNPTRYNEGMAFLIDSNSDLWAYTASMSTSSLVGGLATVSFANKPRLAGTLSVGNGSYGFSFAYDQAPKIDQQHYRWRNDDGSMAAATTLSAEDIPASGSEALLVNTPKRLRIELANEGAASSSAGSWQLEFAKKNPAVNSCATPSPGWKYREIHTISPAASDAFVLVDSANFTNQSATANGDTGSLTDSTNDSFLAGQAVDTTSSTSAFLLNPDQFTENEFSLQPTTNATDGATYCFRLSSGGASTSMSFSVYPKASVSYYTQSAYRFFENANATQIGGPLANQDTPAQVNSQKGAFRLRLDMHVTASNLAQSGKNFKLQYAAKGAGSCASPAGTPNVYTDVGTTTSISFYDNTIPSDGATLVANALDPRHSTDTTVTQTYEEANNFTNSVQAVNAGQDGEWDFALANLSGSSNTTYCFQIARATEGTPIINNVFPEINTFNTSSISVQNILKAAGGGGGDTGGGGSGGGSFVGGGGSGGGDATEPTPTPSGTPQGGGGEGGGGGGSGEGGSTPILYALWEFFRSLKTMFTLF